MASMNRDGQGLPLSSRGEYEHTEPRATKSMEWCKPASFEKLRQAAAILAGVPGGWEEVSLPSDYSTLKGKEKPKTLHVMWRGNRVPVTLAALRIPKIQKDKNAAGRRFYGNN